MKTAEDSGRYSEFFVNCGGMCRLKAALFLWSANLRFARISACDTVSRLMKRIFFWLGGFLTIVFTMFAQEKSPSRSAGDFDVIIRDGTVYDGSGAEPRQTDVAIQGDRIAGIGDFKSAKAKMVIDAKGLAVTPGFINMLSWSNESLIQDGRSQSEIRQGVTTEIMGEGESMGPVNDRVREHMLRTQTRHQIRRQMEHACRVFAVSREARHLLQRRLVHRRDHDSRIRNRI